MEEKHPIWGYFVDIIETIVVAAAIFVVVYLFLLQPHQVRGASMEPNLHDGQYILTDKITYRFRDPKRGEIIVFKAPVDENFDYIKRIIGLPGETVQIKEGKIVIKNSENPGGISLDESYPSTQNNNPGSLLENGKELKIDEGNFFVLGDNRNQSFDSREWGLLPRKNIIGKAWFRYWPAAKISFVRAIDATKK
ncbi:MAG: signal peptidase I [Candidatus Woykebacteria bacterium]